jgi:hypothetical protein
MYLPYYRKLRSKSAPRLGQGIALDSGCNGMRLREKSPDFDLQAERIGKTAGGANLVEARHQIDCTQVSVSLQHSQLFMTRNRRHLGNIEPALE